MKAEGMLQGRLGVREWLNVAQGGARGFLNGFYKGSLNRALLKGLCLRAF